MRLSLQDKDETRRKAPIAAVAAAMGVRLDSDGRGLCPFHDDHSPSFNLWVDPKGIQRWGCFPCGASGDAYDLVQRVERVSFGEAVRRVADISRDLPPVEPPPPREVDHESLAAFVVTAQARAAHETSQGLLCVAASLVTEDADPAYRLWADSRLRVLGWGVDDNANVVMPHYTPAGDLIGAKIRGLGGERWSFPGSSYTDLYGAWIAPTTREVLMTEGETDLAHAWLQDPTCRVLGLPTGAGTLREEWVTWLHASWTESIYLAFDADDAGDEATARWTETLHRRVPSMRVCVLPITRGEDLRSCQIPLSDLLRDAREA